MVRSVVVSRAFFRISLLACFASGCGPSAPEDLSSRAGTSGASGRPSDSGGKGWSLDGVAGATAGSGGASAGRGGASGSTAGTGNPGGAPAGGGVGASGTAGFGADPGKVGFLTEGFESTLPGQVPAGWDTFIGYVKNGMNPQGPIQARVSEARAHTGSRSMHFHGGTSPAMITRPLPMGTAKLYVRVWIYLSRNLGMNPGANHETLLGIRKLSGGANDEVRFGEIKGVIGTNEVPSDNISPKIDRWGQGPIVPANQWICVEVAFLADKPVHTLHAWANGTLLHEITTGDSWQNGRMPATWLEGKFVEAMLGWHSFSSGSNVDVWMDDLVLSSDPVGCD